MQPAPRGLRFWVAYLPATAGTPAVSTPSLLKSWPRPAPWFGNFPSSWSTFETSVTYWWVCEHSAVIGASSWRGGWRNWKELGCAASRKARACRWAEQHRKCPRWGQAATGLSSGSLLIPNSVCENTCAGVCALHSPLLPLLSRMLGRFTCRLPLTALELTPCGVTCRQKDFGGQRHHQVCL